MDGASGGEGTGHKDNLSHLESPPVRRRTVQICAGKGDNPPAPGPSEGDVGLEGAPLRGEALGFKGVLQAALDSGEGLGVAVQAEPEDPGAARVGKCAQRAGLEADGWKGGGYGTDDAGEGRELGIGDVAEEGEGEVRSLGVDPPDASRDEALQTLDVGGNQDLHIRGQLNGYEGTGSAAFIPCIFRHAGQGPPPGLAPGTP